MRGKYLCRYMVTKVSWRGNYNRIMGCHRTGFDTIDPKDITDIFGQGLEYQERMEELSGQDRLLFLRAMNPVGSFQQQLERVRAVPIDAPELAAREAELLRLLGRRLEAEALEGQPDPARSEREALRDRIQEHLSQHPDDTNAHYDLAVTLHWLEAPEAEASYRRVLAAQPSDEGAKRGLSMLLMQRGDYPAALELAAEHPCMVEQIQLEAGTLEALTEACTP